MILIPILALAIGIALGFMLRTPLSGIAGVYMGVAVVAGLDSVFGGVRSALEGKFHSDIFASGFVGNIIVAFFLAWFGDRVGVNLYFAAILIMGWRIFTNLSLIRRFILTRYRDERERRRQESDRRAQSEAEPSEKQAVSP